MGTVYFVCMKRRLGGMQGLVGGVDGGKYDNSHSIQIYGQGRGAPLDACEGMRRTRPLSSLPAKANV